MNRIIKITSCILITEFILASCQTSVSSGLTESDKQYFRDVTTNVQNGWNKGLREPYINRFSADAVFMAPNMEAVFSKDAIRSFANSFPEIKIEYAIKEMVGSSEYAYVRGTYNISNPKDSVLDKGKYISIWKKFPKDKWLLTHDIFNSDLPVSVAK